MIPLIGAILTSAAIALLFKYGGNRSLNGYTVMMVNYLVALIVAAARFGASGAGIPEFAALSDFIAESREVLPQTAHPFSESSSALWTLLLGIATGVIYFVTFVAYKKCLIEHGVGIAGAFSKIGIVVPVILSVLLWREYPAVLQWLGILLALAAIVAVNVDLSSDWAKNFKAMLLWLFLLGGMAEFTKKLFQVYALDQHRLFFLLMVFVSAFAASIVVWWKKRDTIKPLELAVGAAIGVVNLLTTDLLIEALAHFPAPEAFSIFTAGTILTIALGGVLFFEDKPSRREAVAMTVMIAAIALISLGR